MDFTFSEEQAMMADSLSKAYEADYDFDKRRAFLEDTATFHSPAMWSTLAELGFIGLLAPEDDGGIGGGGPELLAVAQVLAKHMALEPFLPTSVMAVRLLMAAGEARPGEVMAALVSGEATMAVALYEPERRYDTATVETSASETDGGFALTGRKAVVIGADAAKWIAVPARLDGGAVAVFLVESDAAGLEINPYRLVDGRGGADLELNQVAVPAAARLALTDAAAALAEVEDWAVTASLAETMGAMEMVSDLTLEYLQTRKQFGRPIGSFQVLQHNMADIMSEVEFARSMVVWAAAEVGNPDARARRHAVSGAKAYVDKAARFVAEMSVQLHGGVGVTDEYALTHHVKRLTLGQVLFGDRDEHLLRYAETG